MKSEIGTAVIFFSIPPSLAVSSYPLYLDALVTHYLASSLSFSVEFLLFGRSVFLLVCSSFSGSVCLSGGFYLEIPMQCQSGNAKIEGVFGKDRNVLKEAS